MVAGGGCRFGGGCTARLFLIYINRPYMIRLLLYLYPPPPRSGIEVVSYLKRFQRLNVVFPVVFVVGGFSGVPDPVHAFLAVDRVWACPCWMNRFEGCCAVVWTIGI